MIVRSILCAIAVTTFVACAAPQDIVTGMPPDTVESDEAGALTLLLTHPSEDVIVAVNGTLVCQGAHTQRIRIGNVKPGWNQVAIAAGQVEKTIDVYVRPGEDHAVPMATEKDTSTAKDIAEGLAGDAAGAMVKGMVGSFF